MDGWDKMMSGCCSSSTYFQILQLMITGFILLLKLLDIYLTFYIEGKGESPRLADLGFERSSKVGRCWTGCDTILNKVTEQGIMPNPIAEGSILVNAINAEIHSLPGPPLSLIVD